MHCLKCGMEIKAPAAFCKECQLAIQNDPVQQDAPIILPVHPKQQADPKPYRHSRLQARQEEVLFAALAILQNFTRIPEFEIGKNYNTIAPEASEPSSIPTAT